MIAVAPRPVGHSRDERLRIAQKIAESGYLSLLLVGDENRLKAADKHGPTPAMESTCFLGEVRVDVAHERRELRRVLDPDEEVVVVREEAEAAEARAGRQVKPLGAGENPQDDLLEIGVGAEEEPPVLRPRRDLDEGSPRGYVP